MGREQSPSFTSRQSKPQCLLQNPEARPVCTSDFTGRTVQHRGETFFLVKLVLMELGCTRLKDLLAAILSYVEIVGYVLTEQADPQYPPRCAFELQYAHGNRYIYSRAACDTPNKGSCIAATRLPTLSVEQFLISAACFWSAGRWTELSAPKCLALRRVIRTSA